jgi:anti-anti-sigma factor
MEMKVEELPDNITMVFLIGSLDIAGAQKIDLPFSTLAGAANSILVDLSQVDFLASIGLRSIVVNARLLTRRGGTIAVLNPQPNVEEVLRTSGIDQIIPIFKDAQAALAALRGPRFPRV